MKGIHSYYVTYMQLPNGIYQTGFFDTFGSIFGQTQVNFKDIIKREKIFFSNFRLETVYNVFEDADSGTYSIDENIIKKELCEKLWDNIRFKYKDVDTIDEIKATTIAKLENEIIIIAWSETELC